MTQADELITHLKHFEGFVPHPYYCAAGKLTIGYGHRIDKPIPDITEEQGHILLLEDIAKYTLDAVRLTRLLGGQGPSVLTDASPRRLNAIIDFCFNCGPVAFAGSRLRLRVLERDWATAAEENGLWVKITDPKTRKKYTSAWQTQRRAVTSEWLLHG